MITEKEEDFRKNNSLGNGDSNDIISATNRKIETEKKNEERLKSIQTLKVGCREYDLPVLLYSCLRPWFVCLNCLLFKSLYLRIFQFYSIPFSRYGYSILIVYDSIIICCHWSQNWRSVSILPRSNNFLFFFKFFCIFFHQISILLDF